MNNVNMIAFREHMTVSKYVVKFSKIPTGTHVHNVC